MEINVAGKREDVAPGAHICQLFNQSGEALSVTISLLKNGLGTHDKCFWAGPESAASEVKEALEKSGQKTRKAVDSTQMLFLTEKDGLLNNGRFDPYYLVSAHQTLIRQAVDEGWQRS